MKVEDELLKRNTDCVYFLASPLTCKKEVLSRFCLDCKNNAASFLGIDCEYWHNEVARLNPRDCWYWLSGNCINPTCGFRHPPWDGHLSEAPSESASLQCQSSIPVNKMSVLCYFYFNAFCNKGGICSFLHCPDGGASTGKHSKAAAAINDALSTKNKTSGGNATGSVPAESHPNPSEITSRQAVDTKVQEKDDILQSSLRSIPQRKASPMMSLSGCEEDTVINSESIPTEGFVKMKSHRYIGWSYEDRKSDHIEQRSDGNHTQHLMFSWMTTIRQRI